MSSLRVKILASLFLVFFASMAAVLLGMWTYQRDKLVDITRREAMKSGIAIQAGLRSAMLQNDRHLLESIIAETAKSTHLSRISLVNKNGAVVLTSEAALKGHLFHKKEDATCNVCHSQADLPWQASLVLDGPEKSFLRSIVAIGNQPACHSCHPADQKINGLLMVDSFLTDTYTLLQTVSRRLVLTGIITFLVIVILISYIVTRFISRPVQAFMGGIKKIEKGNFNSWVDVQGTGEFSDMAVSFNVMCKALNRYMSEVKDKTEEIATLYQIVQRMSETIEWKKVKIIVANLLLDILKAEIVVLIAPTMAEHRFEVTWKQKGEKHYQADYHLSSDAPPHAALAKEELEHWLAGRYSTPLFLDDGSRALVPLQLRDMHLGLLAIRKAGTERFSQGEKKLVPALTHHIAISFANAKLYNLAITDELTSLYTKRYFQSKIADLAEAFRATGDGFCIMMLDLDLFKEVNDTYGHPVGDQVLAKVADLIKANLRQGDIPCRYGGEEFVVLLPGGDINSARTTAERLRKNIADYEFQVDGLLPTIRKTVSIGLSCCPLHAATAEELVMTADSALYAAKRAGRDQVYICRAERDSRQID